MVYHRFQVSKNRETSELMRKKILTIILVLYLVMMALLTILSSEIMQWSLPQVQVTQAMQLQLDGKYYNQVFSSSSILIDDNGNKYVWSIDTRQTPLGDRHYVTSIPVTIIFNDSSGQFVAVEAAINETTKIVSESQTTLKQNDEVRIAQ